MTGKCKDKLTQAPEHLNILYKAFNDTKLAGIHDNIIPSPRASPEVLGLISHSTLHDNKTSMNTKIKNYYVRALPPHFLP